MVRLIEATGAIYLAEHILKAFPPLADGPKPAPQPFRAPPTAAIDERLLRGLAAINADDREAWFRVGAALKHAFGDHARAL